MATTDVPDKQELIADLLNKLKEPDALTDQKSLPWLRQLKVYSREIKDDDVLVKDDSLVIITRYAILQKSPKLCTREALTILANAGLLAPQTRLKLAEFGIAPGLCHHLGQTSDLFEEFLYMRLLLLLTTKADTDFPLLIHDHDLAEILVTLLEKYCTNEQEQPADYEFPTHEMAIIELLKLTYSIMTLWPMYAQDFRGMLPNVVSLFMEVDIDEDKPMEPPVSHMIHALFKFDDEALDNTPLLFPEDDPTQITSRLLEILRVTVNSYEPSELDLKVSPILGLLAELYKRAPEGVRASLTESLLPSDEERTKPLGQADTLAAKLLRLSTGGFTPELRKIIPTVLFELSDNDAEEYVKNVGYGYAAGFLNDNRIPIPAHDKDDNASEGSDTSERAINPITGQYVSSETPVEQPPMTHEEKEQEAERLFVLFERLRATGVMSVQNPIEEAIQSGRFEELDGRSSSEGDELSD